MSRSAVAPLYGKERSGRGKSSEKFTEILAYPDLLLGLADLHVLVDAEGRVADWGVRWGRSVPRGDDEFGPAATADLVGVTVALGSGEIHEPGRRKFVQVDAVAIGGYVGAFGLRDLRDVHANAGKADGLSGSGARIGGGHLLDVIEIDASHDGSGDQDQSESSHEEILTRHAAARNRLASRVHQETTVHCFHRRANGFVILGARTGPSPVAEFPFAQFMVTIANASLLNDLESQREHELAEAGAIQMGMLPQCALRTADVTVC